MVRLPPYSCRSGRSSLHQHQFARCHCMQILIWINDFRRLVPAVWGRAAGGRERQTNVTIYNNLVRVHSLHCIASHRIIRQLCSTLHGHHHDPKDGHQSFFTLRSIYRVKLLIQNYNSSMWLYCVTHWNPNASTATERRLCPRYASPFIGCN